MRAIESWVLGYLVNAAWQAVVIFAGAWLLARSMRRMGPRVEHRVWVAALLAQVALPALVVRAVRLTWGDPAAAGRSLVTVATGDGVMRGGLRLSVVLLSALVVFYAAVVASLALRLLWRIVRTWRLVRQAEVIALEGEAAELWRASCEKAALGEVEVRVSDDVCGPATVGVWRRLLLLPRGFVAAADATELAAAMAHECAHMARWDFAKNLLYQALQLPVAWHPAVWAVRQRVTESREMVCDAMAAGVAGGQREYAGALLRLAARIVCQPHRNLHAIGIFDANRFEERVMRLIDVQQQVKGVRRAVLLAVCVALGLGPCALAAELRVGVAVPAAAQESPAAGKTVPAGIMAGQLQSHVNPIYPPAAKAAKVSGSVVVHAVIARDGSMKSLQIISGPDMLRTSTLEALQQWKYRPYLLNGEPTEVDTTITVNYSLPAEKPAAAEAPSK
jgi:TonB family protein